MRERRETSRDKKQSGGIKKNRTEMNRFNLVKLPKILISLLKLNSVCWVFFFKFDPVSSFCVCLCVIVQKESAQSALVAAGQVYYNVTMCVCVCSVEGQIHLNMF